MRNASPAVGGCVTAPATDDFGLEIVDSYHLRNSRVNLCILDSQCLFFGGRHHKVFQVLVLLVTVRVVSLVPMEGLCCLQTLNPFNP